MDGKVKFERTGCLCIQYSIGLNSHIFNSNRKHKRKHIKFQTAPTIKVFVYKIQVNPNNTILKYGDYYDFMDR